MANKLPTAEELRDSLRRNKPGRLLESIGLLGVIGCAVAGTAVAFLLFEPARAILLGAGACLGLAVGVLAYWLLLYLLGYHRQPAASSLTTIRTKLILEQRQARARQHLGSDELIPSNRGGARVLYTEEDFPCPPAMPGRKSKIGNLFCDFCHVPGEVAFAVVQPHHDLNAKDLQTIGEHLQAWQVGNEYVRRILGIEQLLQGTYPALRADMFSLAAREDREPVVLVYVAETADNEVTGEDLLQRMAGLHVDVVSPGYFSMLRS